MRNVFIRFLKECVVDFTLVFSIACYSRGWIAIFLFMLAGICDLPNNAFLPRCVLLEWLQMFLIIWAKTTILMMIYVAAQKHGKKLLTIIIFSVIVTVCLFSIVNFVSYYFYGFGLTNKLMTIIGQTNFREVIEFMPGLWTNIISAIISPVFWVYIVFIVSLFVIVPYICKLKVFVWVSGFLTVCGCCWTTFLVVYLPAGKTDLFVSTRVVKTIVRSIREQRQLNAIINNVQIFPELQNTTSTESAVDFCLVIGESASRRHHSIYGYLLSTTPMADAMRDSLFIFNDALAVSTATALNLERILGFMPDYDFQNKWYDYPFLIDLLNSAGYKTFWISNQEQTGVWSNSSFAMIANAASINYMGNTSSEDHILMRYDDILLPVVGKAFEDSEKPRFIGVHLKGSHTRYANRYPEEYDIFSNSDILQMYTRKWLNRYRAETVAEYDNSIRYTDHIVASIIGMARRSLRPSIVMYFSDHGENVYDDRNFCGRDSLSVEVPFYIYVNSAFRECNPDLVRKIENAVDRPFSTANIIHTIMTLTSVTNPLLYDSSLDVLSDSFDVRPRYVDGRLWGKDCKK